MTSESFVYITLPARTTPVTAGRFELRNGRGGVPVGRFVYGRKYRDMAEALPLDPLELKLGDQVYETAALGGVFGALRDAGPDHWGRRIIERYLGSTDLGELDYLLNSPDDRAGALGFGLNQVPPAPARKFNRTLDLTRLQAVADAIVADEPIPEGEDGDQIAKLLELETSMGGARPKAVVQDEDGLWIAKFNRKDDKWNNARVEHAMLTLGRACGLTTADSRMIDIGGRDALLVKRFDREKTEKGFTRARMVSGLTLLRSDENPAARDRWSYILLVEELRRVSGEPKRDAQELFRRMTFNALISNLDDHPRNHAAIAKEREWRLSPAYDLTPTSPVAIEQRDLALSCGARGRFACQSNLLSESARFFLPPAEAKAIIERMAEQVSGSWYEVARSCGISEQDCERIRGAFVYPGFES
jgi:serine/threonine-protein kinase HipA